MPMNTPTQSQPSCNDPSEPDALTVDAAVDKIVADINPISAFEQLPIRDSLGRVLFADLHSPMDVPGHHNSAMDGYALAAEDLPESGRKSFEVVATVFAGQPFSGDLKKGQCLRIMTGAMLPDAVDTVVIQEDVQRIDETRVEIGAGHRKHQNIRFRGEDIRKDAVVLARGKTLRAADLGVLASLGVNEVQVFRKPHVSFFSTGDELKSLGETLDKGEIYDSNRYSLFGMLSDCKVEIFDLGVVRDDPQQLQKTLQQAAAHSDVVLTSGGVSVGDADYIKPILQQIGQMEFWKILMKPGRPLTFGKIDKALFFGLPGNPVAVMVTFYQFVLPALKRLQGSEQILPLQLPAVALDDIRKTPGRKEFQRAVATLNEQGVLQARLTGRQGSGILTSMSEANAFMVLPEQSGSIQKGDTVMVELFTNYR